MIGNEHVSVQDRSTQSMLFAAMSHHNFVNDDKGIHLFTGLESYKKFVFVFNTLGPAAHKLTYFYGSVKEFALLDQFLLVLMKLRRHSTYLELSRLFSISERDVFNIFFTWIRFMSLQWHEISIWPSQEVVHFCCSFRF
jgi:Helix-turn-helix of DDE superfamily endonuclease